METNQYGDPNPNDEAANPYASPIDGVNADDLAQPGEDIYTSEMRAFIGPRADYFFRRWEAGKAFNWGAFFLSALYFCYRKMYKTAAFVIGLQVALDIAEVKLFYLITGNEMPEGLGSLTGLLVAIFVGSRATFWYRSYAERKIRELPPETDRETRLQVLARKGGTSFLAPILLLVLFFGLIVAAVLAFEAAGVLAP